MKSKIKNRLSTSALGVIVLALMICGMAMITPPKSFHQADIPSVMIGEQTWSTENLGVTHFRNGEALFEANSAEAWEKANIEGLPAWCYYENNPANGKKYGKLYNFWAVSDKRGLAPTGWHVPTDAEWDKLAAALGGVEKAGDALKSSAFGKKVTKASGFAAVPSGYRSNEGPKYYGGPFFESGKAGYWWSSSRYLVDNSFCRIVSVKNGKLQKDSFVQMAGLSVRLVKD